MPFKFPQKDHALSPSASPQNQPEASLLTPVDWLFLQPEIIDQLHDAIIVTDLEGKISGCNQAASRMFGYTQEELIGQNVTMFYPEENRENAGYAVFERVLEKGQVKTEQRNKTKSGADIYILLTISLLRDPGGNAKALVGISKDITERKLTEMALRQSDQRFHALSQVCPDFFYTTRADGWADYASARFYDFTGAVAGSAEGLNWAEYVHPEDRAKAIAKWMEAVKSGEPFEAEHRYRGKDGEYRWFRSRAIPIKNAKNQVERWVGIGSDIQLQKEAETSLRESECRLRTMAEAIPHSVWIRSSEGFREYVNHQWFKLTGMSAEESLGKGWISAIHPDDRADAMMRWDMAVALNRTFEAEYRVRTADGSYRWQLARAVPHKNEDSERSEWFGTCTDIHDHKVAKDALQERENTLRNFYDHSPFAMGITELQSQDVLIVYGNPATCAMYDVSPNGASGFSMKGLGVCPEELERALDQHRKCLAAGSPVVSEYLREGEGERLWYRETLAPLDTGTSGNPRFTFVAKNITEQKLADEALRKNEEQFRMALRNSPVVAFHQDKDLRYTWIYNPGLGYRSEEVIGKRDAEIFENAGDAAITERLKRSVLETGRSSRTEVCVHDQGTPKYYDLTIEPIRSVTGGIEGVSCTATDVTIRREAEEAFRQQQLILATLIENSSDYIFMKDCEGRYVFINSAAARAVGKLPQEIIGKDDTAIFPPEDAREIMEKEREMMEAGTAEVYEETHPTVNGLQQMQTSKGVCRDARGEIIGVVGMSRDITAAKSAEQALQSVKMAEAAAEMGHALAHEINNPLAALTNSLYLLQNGSKTISNEEMLSAAQDSLSRITTITRQVIGLSRQKVMPERIRVHDVVEDVLASMDLRIRSSGITFEKRLNPAEFHGVEADLRQLISALLENAVEKSQGKVKIRLYRGKGAQNGFRLVIADDGPGIPLRDREKVFEPFFSTKEQRGSGLGLWIARRIAQKYSGTIRLRSSNVAGASGTCIVLNLPSFGAGRAVSADPRNPQRKR